MFSRQQRSNPDALIFDMDGLLLDTERLDRDAFEEACRDAGWQSPDMTVYADCIGTTGSDTEKILRNGHCPDFPWEAVHSAWLKRRNDHLENRPADVKPGAVELLRYANKRELPCALATSTHSSLTATKLALSGLSGYFSVVVAGDDVEQGKPAPEPYITAAQRLGVRPDRCWALEDSANGVRSASAAGCYVFQVPDLVVPTSNLRRLGHEVVESLHDVLAALKANSWPC
ncbi:HAD family hydrolase [Candidatus Foliamicus sp.]